MYKSSTLRILTIISILFLIMGANFRAYSATITSTTTGGLWSVGTTWVGGSAPSPTDNAIIATTGANNA